MPHYYLRKKTRKFFTYEFFTKFRVAKDNNKKPSLAQA